MRFNLSLLALAASLVSAADTTTKATTTATTDDDTNTNTSIKATLTSTTSVSVASGCSFSDTFTVTAQSDLDKLGSCEAVQGDIEIQADFGSAAIANVKVIYGDLSVTNSSSLVALTADSLTTISGTLKLTELYILSTLSFANLESVGAINWVTLPNLVSTGLNTVTECNSILISDTNLNNLEGLNPSNVEIFNVNNNKNLASISSNIETVSTALTVAYNGDDTVVEFDDLKWAYNLTFYSVSSISMSSITYVNKSAGFFESSVEELEFPLITSVGGDLTVSNNDDLTYIDFGNVTAIGGGLVVANNTELKTIDNLDNIETVQGAVILIGDFSNFTMDSLRTVRGSFDLESTGEVDCSPFQNLAKKGSIQGDYGCKAATISSSSSSSGATSTKKSSTSTSSGSGDGDSSATVSSISTTSSKAAAANLQSTLFGTFAAIVLALL